MLTQTPKLCEVSVGAPRRQVWKMLLVSPCKPKCGLVWVSFLLPTNKSPA